MSSQPPGAYPPYGVPQAYPLPPLHPQATTALVLGIVGLAGTFLCGVLIVVGPFAWSYGARVKREIEAEPQRWRGLQEANIGMVLGIVTTALLGVAVVVLLGFLLLVAGTSA